jgi:hypothetical protein
MRRLLVTLALVIALCIAIPGGSAGAAESGSAPTDTIPVGTVITGANWQRYSRFMPAGMQAIFAGDHFWRMPPDVQIEVGPAIPIALPSRYLENTATYAKQVTLGGRLCPGRIRRRNSIPAAGQGSGACAV